MQVTVHSKAIHPITNSDLKLTIFFNGWRNQ
jgi:hypothetical protein